MKLYKLFFITLFSFIIFVEKSNADIWDGTVSYPNHASCNYQISEGNVLTLNNGPTPTVSITSGSDYSIAADINIDFYLGGHYSCYDPLYLVVENENNHYVIHGISVNNDLSQYISPDDGDTVPQYTDEQEWIQAYENGWPGVMCTCSAAGYYSVTLSVGESYSGLNPYTNSYIGIEDTSYYGSTSVVSGSFNNLYQYFQTPSGNWHCPERIYGVYDLGAIQILGDQVNVDFNNENLVEAPCTMSGTVNNITNYDSIKINYILGGIDNAIDPNGENPNEPIYEDNEIFNFCNQWRILKTFSVVHTIINVARILIPLVIIIMASIDLFKVFVSSDEKEFKNSINKFIRRSIIGIAVFFIPTIVKIPINMIDRSDGQFSRCNICFNDDSAECSSIIESLKN